MDEMRGDHGRSPRFEVPRAFDPVVVSGLARQSGLLDRLVELQRVVAAAEAERIQILAEYAGVADRIASVLSADPVRGREMQRRSMVAEIAVALRVSERMVQADAADAEVLVRELPATVDALAAGSISRPHARKMVAHAMSLPTEARAGFEKAVLPIAVSHSPARFDSLATRMRERLHPESITVRTRAAFQERAVWLEPGMDGMASLNLLTSAETAYAIERRLDAHARTLNTKDEPRTVAQLRADVAADLLLGGPAATLGVVPVALMVTVPAATLAEVGEEPGELNGYGPIAPDVARRIAAVAPTFTRVLTRPDTGVDGA